jgi:hypothetical protein
VAQLHRGHHHQGHKEKRRLNELLRHPEVLATSY